MDAPNSNDCQSSYDLVADEYAARIYGELQHKPLDRQLLDRFAARVRGTGPVCDLGCGPGHVTRYLHERGVEVCGIDISRRMVALARCLAPEVEFRQGDMMALDVPEASWAGVVAFYSLIHIPGGKMAHALRELRRVLRPSGLLLVAFHIGDGAVHLDEWWGRVVCVDFFFYRTHAMAQHLVGAGFEIEDIIEREPYPGVEHQSRRAYIFARRPS